MPNNTFIAKVSDFIQERYDLQHTTLSVVFPNKRAALYLRNELKNRIKINYWVPKIYSIEEAMFEWSKMQKMDSIDLIFKLLEINKSIDSRGVDFISFASKASQMAKDFDEIDQYGVDARSLFSNLSDSERIKKWNLDEPTDRDKKYLGFFDSLADYYNRLQEELIQSNQGYYGLITKLLSSKSFEEISCCIPEDRVLFAGFSALTATEEKIIVSLVEGGKADLLWNLDSYYFDDENQEAGLFARRFFKAHPNMDRNFIGEHLAKDGKVINVIAVPGTISQAKALQARLEENHADNQEQAVVLADEEMLIPVLNSIPEQYHGLRVSMGFPFSKSTAYLFVNQLFTLHETINGKNGIYYWRFIRLLDHELVKLLFNPTELNRLNKWKNDFIRKHNYLIDREKDFEHFERETNIYTFLRKCTSPTRDTNSFIDNLTDILYFISREAASKESYFLTQQIETAQTIIGRIKQYAEQHSLRTEDVHMLLKALANEQKIKLYSNENDGLQIMGLLEMRNISYNTINILGVNEGILPKDKSTESFIPYEFRKYYSLPTYEEKQAIYANHFFSILQNSNTINIFYNCLDDDNSKEQSRYIMQIEHELAKANSNIVFNRYNFVTDSPNNESTQIEIEKTDAIIDKMLNLYGENQKPDKDGKKHTLSPSSIADYRSCPLKFYLQNVERVREDNIEEIAKDNELGTLIHRVFELLYTEFKDNSQIINLKDYCDYVEKNLARVKDTAIKEQYSQGLSTVGFNNLVIKVVDEYIDKLIYFEKKHLADHTIEFIGLEDKSNQVAIETSEGNVLIGGIIDRIDRYDGEIRVLDYKTGKVEDNDVSISSPENEKIKDKAFQLMIYKYIYLKNHDDVNAEDIEMGIISFRRQKENMLAKLKVKDSSFEENFEENASRLIEDVVKEIFDRGTPFTQNTKNCKNCSFKSICKQYPKSY